MNKFLFFKKKKKKKRGMGFHGSAFILFDLFLSSSSSLSKPSPSLSLSRALGAHPALTNPTGVDAPDVSGDRWARYASSGYESGGRSVSGLSRLLACCR